MFRRICRTSYSDEFGLPLTQLGSKWMRIVVSNADLLIDFGVMAILLALLHRSILSLYSELANVCSEGFVEYVARSA